MKSIPYATQWIEKDDIKAVSAALCADYLTQGPRVFEFEEKVANYCGARYAVAVNSGTSALHLACLVAGIGPGDEVITSPITFVASANCILYCKGRPVFADVREDTINIAPDEIRKKISKKTKAIIPVHFAGNPCDLKEISQIAKEKNLLVIEDAAHALGAEYKGSKIGSCKYSDMTVFSFHAVKHITTGEGGMVLTNNKKFYEKLKKLRSHGIIKGSKVLNKLQGDWYYEMRSLGFNYRLTDIQCVLGISQMNKLDRFLARRREIARAYNKAFAKINGLKVLSETEQASSAWHLYVIRVAQRKRIFDKLRDNGIMVNVHYIPVYKQPYYQNLGYGKALCKNAENYYDCAISIPMFPKMNEHDLKCVVNHIKEALK